MNILPNIIPPDRLFESKAAVVPRVDPAAVRRDEPMKVSAPQGTGKVVDVTV